MTLMTRDEPYLRCIIIKWCPYLATPFVFEQLHETLACALKECLDIMSSSPRWQHAQKVMHATAYTAVSKEFVKSRCSQCASRCLSIIG